MAVGDWSAAVLCRDSDLREYESSWPWGDDHDSRRYRDKAKEHIERELRVALAELEVATDESDALDLVSNPEVLTPAACCLTFALAAEDNVTGEGDGWTRKQRHYQDEFEKEFKLSVALLHTDTDESGTIEDTEKYNVGLGTEFTRGG